MLGRVIRVIEVPISLSLRAMGRGAVIAGRVAGWTLARVQQELAPDRSRDWSPAEEPVEDFASAQPAAEPRAQTEEERPLAREAGDGRGPAETAEEPEVAAGPEPELAAGPEPQVEELGVDADTPSEVDAETELGVDAGTARAEQGQDSGPLSAQEQPHDAPLPGEDRAPVPEERPESEVVEHEPGAGTSVRARSPHSPLNNPVTEPDLTEWPDPYEHREDPRDPGEDMVFGDDAGHTPTGATSTSEPHPSHDPEAVPWEGPKRDKVDQ